MRSPFTFLQIADVHLESKLPLDNLPRAHRQRRNRESLNCLWQAFALVRKRNLDAVIADRDLFDNDSVKGETVGRIIEDCKDIAPTPVIIAPGNRDYFCPESLYNSRVIATRGIPSWPPNVHIFQSPDFTTFAHPLRDDISFTGRAFTDPAPIKERLLKEHWPKNEEWKFVEALLALKKEAEENESVNDNSLSSPAVEDALYYGLDALKQKRVTVRDVD